MHEQVNRNRKDLTWAKCGVILNNQYSTTTQYITFKIWSPTLTLGVEPIDLANTVHHIVYINDVYKRDFGDPSDVIVELPYNVNVSLYALVACGVGQTSYDRTLGGTGLVIFQPLTDILKVEITDMYCLRRSNTKIAVGDAALPPGNFLTFNGEQVGWGTACPTSYKARNTGVLPPNQPMAGLGLKDNFAHCILFAKETGILQQRIGYIDENNVRFRTQAIESIETGTVITMTQSNNSIRPEIIGSSFLPFPKGIKEMRVVDRSTDQPTDKVYEREYTYLVFANDWIL